MTHCIALPIRQVHRQASKLIDPKPLNPKPITQVRRSIP